jgi:iron complex outermembrane recepter protein
LRQSSKWAWIQALVFVAVLALVVGPTPLAAQTPTIAGVVVDQSGGAIQGARVSLSSTVGGSPTITTTNAAGEFVFAGVTSGRYVVRVERDLFRPVEMPALPAAAPLRITLARASLSEAVQVSYRAPSSAVGTKIDVPLSDIPQSIQVVPLAVLQDRGVTRVEQLVETVSGVHAEASYGSNLATFFNVRGFSTSSGLRDGFRSFGYVSARDVQAVERVEVLKGPASVLYGATASLGGYVNTVSKQPVPTNVTDVGVTVTPYGARATTDVNRRLNDSGTLRGRANLSVEHDKTFRDHGQFRSFNVAPSISWAPSGVTDVSALVEYNYLSRDGFDFGLPNIPEASRLSRTRYFGSDEDFGRSRTLAATVVSQHQVSTNWRWREAFNYVRARQRSYQSFLDAPDYAGGSRIDLWLFPRDQETDHDWSIQSELSGQITTGGIRHRLLAGFEVAGAQVSYAELGLSHNEVVTIDLFEPTYRSEPSPLYDSTPYRQPNRNQGVYVQDLMDVAPTVKVLAGLRLERLQTRVINDGVETDDVATSQSSPRVGLVWQPRATVSVYGSWSRAFSPVLGRSSTGAAFDPETGEQYEVGWKQQLPRATATVALFDLRRKGVLTLDPDAPQFYVQSGEQRSRGLETDLAGESSLGINWTASYAYTRAEVTSDNSFPVGDFLANVPRHSGSLWATYRRRDGRWPGVSLGAGVFASGAREATLPNTFELSGYTRMDAMVAYGRGSWNARVNILNVFNAKYLTGGSAGVFNYTVTPSAPATVQLTLTRRL